jgi:hypothetical protein
MKTKIFLFFFALLTLGLQNARAQANYNYNRPAAADYLRNEVYAQYGVVNTQSTVIVTRRLLSDISTAILNAVIEELGFDESINYTRDYAGTRGAIGIGYNRYLAPRWTLGAMANYHGFRTTINFENGQTAFLKDDFYTFMLRTDYRWVNQPGVQLYSGLCLGGTWWQSGYEEPSVNVINNSFFNMQFTPLGIRVGKQIGGFVEFGLGANGLIAGGISGKF